MLKVENKKTEQQKTKFKMKSLFIYVCVSHVICTWQWGNYLKKAEC